MSSMLGGLGGGILGGLGNNKDKRRSVVEELISGGVKNIIKKEKIIERALTNKFATIKRRRTSIQDRKNKT